MKEFYEGRGRRKGRPPAGEEGFVDERILEAATDLFLKQGFGRTTLDKVSSQAGVGKSGLYGRYSSKESLFEAVVLRSIATMFEHMVDVSTIDEGRPRMQTAGEQLIDGMLHPRCVALMRITASEAVTFPHLAKIAYQASFDGSVRYVLKALGKEASEEQAEKTARRFVELVAQPLSFQAAFGIDPQDLRSRRSTITAEAILFLREAGYTTSS